MILQVVGNSYSTAMDFYIDRSILAKLSKGSFYYPACGQDTEEPIKLFGHLVSEFWFCDLCYDQHLDLPPVFPQSTHKIIRSDRYGEVGAQLRWVPFQFTCAWGRSHWAPYRYLEPSYLSEVYLGPDGNTTSVVRRRGFGQLAIEKDFHDDSISIFMHRGDSIGEGGSGMWLIDNREARYEPISNIFEKLESKLTENALIISDGSNTRVKFLNQYNWQGISGRQAYKSLKNKRYEFGNRIWRCIGWLSRRYGPTLVWNVVRKEKGEYAGSRYSHEIC